MVTVGPDFHMWVTLAVIGVAIVSYAVDRVPLEVTSIGVLAFLLLFFQFFPLTDPAGGAPLTPQRLIAGLADPALVAVLALLIVGQGVTRTGALAGIGRRLALLRRHHPVLAVAAILVVVLALSGILNNTPVVVIFIPIMAAVADRLGRSPSSVMIPLSFAAILGGMTTLIGSSTNLLVSGMYVDLGFEAIGFFDFTVPGLVLAGVGFVYVLFVVPRLLPDRASYAGEVIGADGKHFVAQLEVAGGGPLVGERAVAGMFPSLPDITVRLVQRGERAIFPPFDGVALTADDIVVVSATRKALTAVLESHPGLVHGAIGGGGSDGDDEALPHFAADQVLAEAIVAPAARIIGRNLRQIVFHKRTDCVVLGLRRRSHMIRARMTEIRLEAGDVLLVLGPRAKVTELRNNSDVVLLEWSARELPARAFARRAGLVFAGVILAAASGLVPIMVASVAGAAAMIITRCLNIHQASRAVDRRVLLLVWTALALGAALHATGGARWLALTLVSVLDGTSPAVTLSAYFLLVAVMTNVLSNNATAVLFTPIAVNVADALGVSPVVFVFATVLAANCSFATPVGYQTNLLVMGPGHYRFSDYLRAGTPLIILLWLTFSLFAPWYYGL